MNRNFKIEYFIKIVLIMLYTNFSTFHIVAAQSKIGNKYGLVIINNTKILQNEIDSNQENKMVSLRKAFPEIKLDLKYTTAQNFMHHKLYPPIHTAFLRKPAVDNLKNITRELKKQNLGIKIFDAYRPYSITEKMWEKVKDSRYAADPAKGSGHNRGAAVDLTIIDLKTGKELPMGTGFDNFSDTAHPGFINLPKEILKNREILKTVMEKYGFEQLSTEWWHFYLPNSSSFQLLDISFRDLIKMDEKKS